MDQPGPILVRGRCACGRRYRIRNAQAGITVLCPNCRRPIPITDADLRAAMADARLIPIQAEAVELLEAILIDRGELRLASEGSRPGLTGKKTLDHEEAMLASAMRGSLTLGETYDEIRPTGPGASVRVLIELEPGQRGFVYDLLASLCFAGLLRNALNVLAIAILGLLMGTLAYSVPPELQLFIFPAWALFVVLVVQFYWSVLRRTAFGEDRVPLVAVEESIWHDAVKPTFWLAGVSLLCWLPAGLLGRFGPPAVAAGSLPWWLALGVGWFFWPVAVMSVGLGNSITLLRPDWLVRCVIGIGPAYLIVWGAALVSVAGWFAFPTLAGASSWTPALGLAAQAYWGYVVFRTLGLLFRRFRKRFPWKY